MNNTQPNLKQTTTDNQADLSVIPRTTEALELFAEDLPVQHDLRSVNCLGSVSTASSITGSTLGTAACLSSL